MHTRSLENKKKPHFFQNWFYARIFNVSWIATKALTSLENLGTEVSQVDCDMIFEGIIMARIADSPSVTKASSWQGGGVQRWEVKLAFVWSITPWYKKE